jgi:hypothetical protein
MENGSKNRPFRYFLVPITLSQVRRAFSCFNKLPRISARYAVSLWVLGVYLTVSLNFVEAADSESYYQKLTLAPANTVDPMGGPLLYRSTLDTVRTWAFSPLFSYTLDNDVDFEEFDFLYPILSYDRFGSEYRFHIFQIFNFSGGQTQTETNVSRFTLFPIYFQQRSPVKERNYTALLPIYGTLKNRLFRDEVHFILMPIYVQSRKRDVVTDNYVYPFVHVRHGERLDGWQFWPFFGREHKGITYRTNSWGDAELIGGHDRLFVLWPFYFNSSAGIGTENPVKQNAIVPLYAFYRSSKRDSSTYFWPFGYTRTIDREKDYTEIGAPWPIVVFADGPGKRARRVWPFFSQASTPNLESDFYLWPVYKYNRVKAEPLDRERTRILFFLYSNTSEKNTETGKARTRRDFWPLFTKHHDFNGDERFQILSILEPLVPNNKSIERNYSPVWALWRSEKSPKTGARSQALLWNLYRRESSPTAKKLSLLFGLFRYYSGADGRGWSLFYIPVSEKKTHVEQ